VELYYFENTDIDDYVEEAFDQRRVNNQLNNTDDIIAGIMEGAILRVRPKPMTVSIIIAGLLPIMLGMGTGSEVM
jgi:copper/silver efflux system protein